MIRAEITIIECDRCGKIVVLKNEDERDEYKRAWYDDGVVNYCKDCRVLPPAITRNRYWEAAFKFLENYA